METIAILKNARLSVDDRGLVALRFDAAVEGLRALQILYLEGDHSPDKHYTSFIALIRAAGNFEKLNGLPIIVEKSPGTMTFVRPAEV